MSKIISRSKGHRILTNSDFNILNDATISPVYNKMLSGFLLLK